NNTSKMKNVLLNDVKGIENPFLSAPCDKPWNNMAIKYDGLTGHCGLLLKGEDIGSKSLKDIWYGPFLEGVRLKMLKKELFEHCSKCVPSDVTQRRRLREELKKVLKNG
ncbi:MAG: SPASM domain-containing protein, partial [Bacteroidota bacterium]|nr:SPASM domain-containing protein [Bacteroidota bacterium]